MSESLRMDPGDVPEDLTALAVEARTDAWPHEIRAVLAAVLPEFERQVREWIADEINGSKTPCEKHPMPFPRPSCWTCARNGAFNRSADIARGETS